MYTKLTVTAASAFSALTTLDRVKAELDITGTSSDALLTAKIAEASSDIEAHIGTVLRQEAVRQLYWSMRRALDVLELTRYPVASVTAVSIDDESVAEEELRIEGLGGLLYRTDSEGYPCRWFAGKQIQVDYVAGYILPGQPGRNLPAVIESAAIELVQSFWTAKGRDPLIRAEDVPGVGRTEYWVGAVGSTGPLLPSVEAKIAPFRRPVVA